MISGVHDFTFKLEIKAIIFFATQIHLQSSLQILGKQQFQIAVFDVEDTREVFVGEVAFVHIHTVADAFVFIYQTLHAMQLAHVQHDGR